MQPHDPRCTDLQCPACYVWIGRECRAVVEVLEVERHIEDKRGNWLRSEPSHVAVYTEER